MVRRQKKKTIALAPIERKKKKCQKKKKKKKEINGKILFEVRGSGHHKMETIRNCKTPK